VYLLVAFGLERNPLEIEEILVCTFTLDEALARHK
jgi:hypothetical protein